MNKPSLASHTTAGSATGLDARQIVATLKRSADWQLANPIGTNLITFWVAAPYYDGLFRLAQVTGDSKYLGAVISYGNQAGWMPHYHKYHADDVAVGHTWFDVYRMDPSKKHRLEPVKARVDSVLASPIGEALDFRYSPKTPGVEVTDRWTWCDALYMAPPTYSRLALITGDAKYLEFMDREFAYTYDQLYDKEEKLFFRDSLCFVKKTPSGKKTFWSRGNGWVYGGLGFLLETMPKTHSTYAFYENLFRDMTKSVLATQQPDGLWRTSLLDPNQIPIGELSGSAFYVFGLAWGVNHGLLDRATVWPAIERGWKGLMTCVKPDGYVGFVQRIGFAPDDLGPDSRQDYGTGAFLLAGSEIVTALGGATPAADPAKFLAEAEALAELKEPRAYARLVPERKDDLAWENDKVAFRIYGPGLRDSLENSGIDVWSKRVPYPILNKWFALDIAGKLSYHVDHGEGMDQFNTGDSRGCGGLGIWHGDKLVISNVYEWASIYDTTPDEASFRVDYRYPAIDGKTIVETRHTTLRMGEQLFDVEALFLDENRKPIPGLTIAAGLFKQTSDAVFFQDAATGIMAVWDRIDGEALGTGLAASPASVLEMRRAPHGDKGEQALCFFRTDSDGKVRYRAGFTWSKAGEITTLDAWKAYLAARTSHFGPVFKGQSELEAWKAYLAARAK
ncbi:MAG: glycoside hydrolase family 88 protein [Opitutaceae bacterium]|jgi:rhamnogalacturonyl hydrolase YesR